MIEKIATTTQQINILIDYYKWEFWHYGILIGLLICIILCIIIIAGMYGTDK
jgi:hypothetical protein